jgi:hypothetical protein
MQEFTNLVTTKTQALIDNGTIDNMIESGLKSMIADIIKDTFRSYSDFGKVIKEKIEASINVSLQQITFPEYNLFIKDVALNCFNKILKENVAQQLSELITDSLPPVEKTEKISTLLNRIKESWIDDARRSGKDSIAIEAKQNDDGDALYITFHHPEFEFEDIKISLYNWKKTGWHIGYIFEDGAIGGKTLTGKYYRRAATTGHEITGFLYQYYAMQTIFELDVEVEDIYIGDDY